MSTVAIIPARGGSVRIPRKNVRDFHGRPIIAYSIETAKDSGLFDQIIVSTDDNEIAEVAHDCEADVMRRGSEWCGDEVGPLDVARHTLGLLAPDVNLVCMIYATAPLMSVEDLECGAGVLEFDCGYAVSVGATPFLHDAAQFIWCKSWALRQHVPEFSGHTRLVQIAPQRDCDINTESDWLTAERMYAKLHGLKAECCGHIHQADAGGYCADCPDAPHTHRWELQTSEVPEMVHFRCACGVALPT